MGTLANQLIEQLSIASTWSISSTQIAPSNLPRHPLARPCPALQQTPLSSRLVSSLARVRTDFLFLIAMPTCKRRAVSGIGHQFGVKEGLASELNND